AVFLARGMTYFPRPRRTQSKVAQMRIFALRCLLLAVPMAGALAQTPALQMNVVYVCTDGQSFKVFSCDAPRALAIIRTTRRGRHTSGAKRSAYNWPLCSRQNATRKRLPKRGTTRTAARFHPRLLHLRRARVLATALRDPQLH